MVKTNINLEDMSQNDVVEYLSESVQPEIGAIPASLLGDPKIYDLEHKKVFLKTWIFVGHESEIPNKNDFMVIPSLLHEALMVKFAVSIICVPTAA
ncbi:hypothetical protein [Bacillus sp. OV166]|uniref:hypothetical protein n=1 Tax=Bacillus sp. OV166 TaxID=1882763 RepID=UPI00211AB323|nr:hypothetical protein [Bacillus sp. OV166]